MLILVARYTFFFWLFIGNSHAERFLLKQIVTADEELFRSTACTARCLLAFGYDATKSMYEKKSAAYGEKQQDYQKNLTLQQCFNECQQNRTGFAKIESVKQVQENFRLKLVCRDDQNLHLRIDWNHAENSVPNESSPKLMQRTSAFDVEVDDKVIFFIRINKANDLEKFWVYLTDENFISFGNLTHNSVYNITAVAVHATNQYSVISKMQHFKTLQRGYVPGNVTHMQVINYSAGPDAMQENRLTANIIWKPSADMTCHYNIICFSTETAEYEMAPLEIRNPRQLYSYAIENLTFSKEYSIGIRAKNTRNESNESALQWMTFRAPSCVEYYDYNFQICPPLEPEGLQLETTFLRENVFSLNVSWQLPQYLPDYYELRVLDLSEEGGTYERNISKNSSNYFFDEITFCGFMYDTHLTAYTVGGNSTSQVIEMLQNGVTIPDQNNRVKLMSAIFVPIFCIMLFSLTTFILCHRRAKLRRYEERCKYFEELEKKAPIDPRAAFDFPTTKSLPRLTSSDDLKQFQLDLEDNIFFNDDSMEIERCDVTLHEVLGEGAFGLVRRGVYRNKKSDEMHEVAVKMLKEQPAVDDIRAFRREIEVMKSVEQHPNIIGLIGHCTKHYNEMLLLTEYCSMGNLLDFLRDEWKYLHDIQLKTMMTQEYQASKQSDKKFLVTTFKYNKNNINKNNGLTTTTTTATVNPNGKLAAINKSYGYDDICTNSCKCQVEIVQKKKSANTNEYESVAQIVAIKDCECQQQKQQHQKLLVKKNNQRNIIEMDLPTEQGNEQQQSYLENKTFFGSIEKREEQQEPEDETTNTTTTTTNTSTITGIFLQRTPLTAADLLDIAKQVATGMEFLSKNKVVHRDLAARNILVTTDRTIKIADFGLSRDIYQENIYKKTGNGKLPIKWLALESMTHQVYTTQSDVWSYGILLHEIVTLGGTPYPAIPTNRLLHMLKTGYRMEKPKNCGEEFYNLMSSCWHGNPGERPTFTQIITKIDKIMCDDMYEPQIETTMLTAMQTAGKSEPKPIDSVGSDDAYLKPL